MCSSVPQNILLYQPKSRMALGKLRADRQWQWVSCVLTPSDLQAEYTKALEAYHSSPAYQQYLAAKSKGR